MVKRFIFLLIVFIFSPLFSISNAANDENFKAAIENLFRQEGGYVNDPQDKGGATKYGISLNFLKSLGKRGDINNDNVVNENDIKIIDKNTAIEIYKKEFWDKYGFHRINNEIIAETLFDFSVNMGSKSAIKLIQKALNLHDSKQLSKENGVLDDQTIFLINISNPLKLMLFFRAVVSWHYIQITEKDSSQKKFIYGWLKRVWSGV